MPSTVLGLNFTKHCVGSSVVPHIEHPPYPLCSQPHCKLLPCHPHRVLTLWSDPCISFHPGCFSPCFFLCTGCREKQTLTPCWNSFFDLLFVAFVTIVIHNALPQRILPLYLTVQLKCPCSEPCLPVDGRKEEINTSPAWGLPFWEIFARFMGFLLYFLLPLSLIYKRTWHPDPIRWLRHYCAITSVRQLSGIKLYSLPQQLVSWIYWPVMHQAERAWTW